jgi:hypothetical protein
VREVSLTEGYYDFDGGYHWARRIVDNCGEEWHALARCTTPLDTPWGAGAARKRVMSMRPPVPAWKS